MSAGWSLGLSRAGYRTVAMCEIDPWRRAVLEARHSLGHLPLPRRLRRRPGRVL